MIRDTTGKTYQPVAVDPNLNRTAYRPLVVNGGDQIPVPGSLARENLTQGGLILFKVQSASYASRPLELRDHAARRRQDGLRRPRRLVAAVYGPPRRA